MAVDRFTLRAGTPEDHDEIYRVLQQAFNDDPDDAEREDERLVYEPDRAILVESGPTLAGVAGAYTRELTVPGGALAAGHVTMVGVEPAFRRQGVLTRMMTHQLADIRARGETVAILWASEGRIYQRFGYGLAARKLSFDVEREARFRVPPAPGGLRPALHEGDGGVDGYALWRVRGDWSATGPQGEVMVREVVAATTEAYRSLWHHLLTMDLTRTTSMWLGAVDEPLLYLVDEPRRLGARLGDGLWLRLTDVPAALARRRYAAPVDVTIAVEDPLIPDNTGTWHLAGDRDGARCGPADRPAELRAELAALGAVYLGDASLATLAAAGRVTELVPGTLAPTATAFGWPRPPSAVEIF